MLQPLTNMGLLKVFIESSPANHFEQFDQNIRPVFDGFILSFPGSQPQVKLFFNRLFGCRDPSMSHTTKGMEEPIICPLGLLWTSELLG